MDSNGTSTHSSRFRIAGHNLHHPWRPLKAWPDNSWIQWGESGLVLSERGNYSTAFVEIFSDDPNIGFLRGEGASLDAAEEHAFAQYRKASDCNHVWGRRGYRNGVGVCLKCGFSKSNIFKPVVVLGSHLEPLNSVELSLLSSGMYDGDPVPGEEDYKKKLRLRARREGLVLPSKTESVGHLEWRAAEEAWMKICEETVGRWVEAKGVPPARQGRGMLGLMETVSAREIKRLAKKHAGKEAPVS